MKCVIRLCLGFHDIRIICHGTVGQDVLTVALIYVVSIFLTIQFVLFLSRHDLFVLKAPLNTSHPCIGVTDMLPMMMDFFYTFG